MGIFTKLFGKKNTENNLQNHSETKAVQSQNDESKTNVGGHSRDFPKEEGTKPVSVSQNTLNTITLTIEAHMWECFFNNENKAVEILRKDVIGSIELSFPITDQINDIKGKAIEIISQDMLPNHLQLRNLHQFMPMQRPTFVKREEIIEICYYHDINFYNIKFGELEETGYVMQLTDPEALSKLEDLCNLYSLNPSDYI